MKRLIAWFVQNGVAANLLIVVIMAGGLITLPRLKEEVFPELESDSITVTVPYPGATPSEVEEAICMRVEEAVDGLADVKRIRSRAREGVGTVIVEMIENANRSKLLDEVKNRVDSIDTFPEDAEKPQVQEMVIRRQVVNVAVSGNADEKSLRTVAERVRDEISALPGISLVTLGNARPYEISIEVPEENLRRYGLTFDEIAAIIRRSSLDLPGGSVKTRGGEILVRTKGQSYRGGDFERIPILTRPDGTRLELRDIGSVIDGFADTDQYTRFDGKPTILVRVFRVGDQGALEISSQVMTWLENARHRMPEGISLTLWQDDSKILRSRLDLMVRNGRTGLFLVLVTLTLFLRPRLALWVAFGIPASFLGAIWTMPVLGVSISLISLFAFIVVLGIVVDDAIVVSENVHTRIQRGETSVAAATHGAQEVALPVVFAVLTTIAAFVPLLVVPGRYGQIMRVIPLIVIPTLCISLVESLFVLPRHLSHLRPDPEPGSRRGAFAWLARFQASIARALEAFAEKIYRPVVSRALEWRYFTVAVALVLLVLTTAWVASGRARFTFFPPVDADNVVAFITMPQGTPVEITEGAVRSVEEAAGQLREELVRERGDDIFRYVVSSVGGQPFREAQSQNQGQSASFSGAHLAEVNIELLASEERSISSTEVADRLREKVGVIPDAEEVVFSASIFASGNEIAAQLASENLPQLREASEWVKDRLRGIEGTTDIADSFRAGKEELQFRLRPAAENWGIRLSDLAHQVRQGFWGEEVQRIQRGRDDVKVMLRYPENERRSLESIESMRIRTPSGAEVPFPLVATVERERGFSTIDRSNRRRVIDVTAGVKRNVGNETEINQKLRGEILPEMRREFPGVTYSFEGDQRDRGEALAGLVRGIAIALILIYALLAIPFRSYFQPLIVMSAIPFGIAGAIWGHVILGLELTFVSFFGLVALIGVLVNDSLVLVDFINRRRENESGDLHEAVREAGVRRFRPILLTSLTTFAGLTPILLERSLQARFLIPMAVSLGFGVLFATFITLLFVPVAYFVLEDIGRVARRVWYGSGAVREDCVREAEPLIGEPSQL